MLGGWSKLPLLVVCALVVCAAAFAQSTEPIQVKVDVVVTPDKAGTPAHPQGIHIDVRAHITIPEQYDPPLVDKVKVWFPNDGVYNGGKFPTCSLNALNRKGPKVCPKGSIVGHGTGDAKADTVITHPKITIVNGGARRVYFYTVLNNPARVETPVIANVTKTRGRWGYTVEATIPKSLQIVAGVPIVLKELHLWGGKGDYVATTRCPADHQWPYQFQVTFTNGSVNMYHGSVGCRS